MRPAPRKHFPRREVFLACRGEPKPAANDRRPLYNPFVGICGSSRAEGSPLFLPEGLRGLPSNPNIFFMYTPLPRLFPSPLLLLPTLFGNLQIKFFLPLFHSSAPPPAEKRLGPLG